MDKPALDNLLDSLEAKIPQMLRSHLDMNNFWKEFSSETDYLFAHAGENVEHVRRRVDRMISDHVMIPGDG